MENDKCVFFSKDDFSEESWEILCSEFEVDSEQSSFCGHIIVEEDDSFDLDDDDDEE
ncbi:MAG: hypothetical protein K0R54_5449 [Clostridiaceae bacterium]|jgi:hypothetical protein|nr:hypothetical protein [Clostridiaceae bacterium]MDF2950501.1 hypothetical protein [Anaerocolumna sp.]